jgi:uncharacterized protein YjiS (DUF1127 family)
MAFANDTNRTHAAGASLWDRVADLRADFAERAAKYRLYRATLNELSSLTDRDLADLGLHREIIADVAREAAYKA